MHDVFFRFIPSKALSTSRFFELNFRKTIALKIFYWYLNQSYNCLQLAVEKAES